MKRIYSVAMILLIGIPMMLTLFGLFTLQAKAPEILIFEDDFESYSTGTFPSAGGWQLVWNGRGNSYQMVVDTISFSGTKSFQLWGAPNWSAVAQKKFTSTSPRIGYELAIIVDSVGSGGPGRVEHPAFFNREAYVWGRYYASVNFNHDDMKIHAEKGEVLGDWAPGIWYSVRVILDREVNEYNVWINGELRGTNLPTAHEDTELINAIALVSDHAGVKVNYDNVKVFEAPLPQELQVTLNIDPDTLSSKSQGKWITAYIELPEGYDVNNINVSTILLNGTVQAEMHPTGIGDEDSDGIPDLMVKFSRDAVLQYLRCNLGFLTPERIKPLIYCIKLTVTGSLTDGTAFEGTDTISTVQYLKGYPEPV